MLTYDFEKRAGKTLYEYLYERIKDDIITGRLKPEEKLPSKREMAVNNGISVITVENAYEQLLVEGYINSIPKKGFYVCDIDFANVEVIHEKISETTKQEEKAFFDFTVDAIVMDGFPFSIWSKLMRRTLLDNETNFLLKPESIGIKSLREAIAGHLKSYRGLNVNPCNVIVGAGMEYLYSLVVALLGRNGMTAFEDPGYINAAKVFENCGSKVCFIPLDEEGISISELRVSKANLVHVTPSHHFPLGIVTSAARRHSIIKWAVDNNAYILEDDYDSEFRFKGKPIPAMASINPERVIYMNTFSKTLAPSIRIAYMVLPDNLMEEYRKKLSFYSGTVTGFEQYTLANFINEGYLERHINRMRNSYRKYREKMLGVISQEKYKDTCYVSEGNIGLHFILGINTEKEDDIIKDELRKKGYIVRTVSDFCVCNKYKFKHQFIINYYDITISKIDDFLTEIETIR